jgi:peptide/nickel transport system permease protein
MTDAVTMPLRHARSSVSWARGNVRLTVALTILVALLLAAFLAPLPYDPTVPESGSTLQAPSSDHWFGTDRSGLDVFSRTIASAKLDLPLAIGGTLASMLVGVPLGLLASTKGRWSERMMRGLDIFQAFPLLVLAIVIVALTGNNLRNIVFAIALINVPRFIRLVRSEALSIRESRYVEAATAIGASPWRVLRAHILPNVTATIVAQASLVAAQAIVVIAALSFLGIGITPPDASWGAMIQSGAQNMTTGQWWVVLFPGLAVFLVVICFNELADGVQSALADRGRR